jgi:peptidoglycan/xylan/chitin deacetylase (PgdA/CDA1 family)
MFFVLTTLLMPGFPFARAPSAQAAIHDPDTEAQEIFEARQAEQNERIISLESTALEPSALACRYASDIVAPPPHMRVALTFDDGPDANGTPYILDVLAKYKIHATFFMIGRSAAHYPELVDRVVRAGHLIVGNHSYTHPDFHKLSVVDQQNETLENIKVIGQYQTPKFFRYPYGNSTCEENDFVHRLGYKIVGWHVDSCDWAFNKTGSVDPARAKICEVQPQFMSNFQAHVVDRLHARKGGILLMHEIQPNTIRQLEDIVQTLIHDGFTFGVINRPIS